MQVYDGDHSTRFAEKKKRGTRFDRGISRNRTNEARTNEAILYTVILVYKNIIYFVFNNVYFYSYKVIHNMT